MLTNFNDKGIFYFKVIGLRRLNAYGEGVQFTVIPHEGSNSEGPKAVILAVEVNDENATEELLGMYLKKYRLNLIEIF